MDEGGTLDFEDLMDTGDDFPGFEISKFTPANQDDGNDDGVLRTPEHERDDEDDYVITENKNYNSVNDEESEEFSRSTEVTHSEGSPKTGSEVNIDEDTKRSTDNNTRAEIVDMAISKCGDISEDSNSKDTTDVSEKVGHRPKTSTSENCPEVISEDDQSNDMKGESEPAPKKKKYYLKPPQKKPAPQAEKTFHIGDAVVEINETDKSDCSDGEQSKDSTSVILQNGENDHKEDGEEEKNVDDKSPHQQSFLSFFNLKPGSSSKQSKDELKKEQSLQKEFFSRKRLRTRKKVSYCEDVAQDEDDTYNVDDDEEEQDDHQLVTSDGKRPKSNSRRSSGGSNPGGSNSGGPNPGGSNSGGSNPAALTSPAANYTQALQNLLPGVDLSCLKNDKKYNAFVPVVTTKGNNMDSLKQHGNLKGLFECGICGLFFNTASQFITHQEKVHAKDRKEGRSPMETFRCEVCGFVLTNRFAYLEHKKMKHQRGGTPSISCTKCKTSKFTDLAALQKHKEVCGLPFCSTCGATFNTWVEVAEHRKQAHNTSANPTRQWLNCVIQGCPFKCVTQHEMSQHVKLRHTPAEFSCNAPRCSLVFDSREKLVEHKKEAHSSEFIVQYQCMECKNCFSSKTLLAEHQYLHTLERLRKCDLCLHQFASVRDLRKHKDVHACKSPLQCQSCLRWCEDKVTLINHVCAQKRRNTGIRLYFCDVCRKDFKSDEKMFEHRKEHKNYFQCATCFWDTDSETAYFEHRETHGQFMCRECYEELEEKDYEMHKQAHQYYTKVQILENDGKNEKVMFLCPNLFNGIQT